MTTLSNLFSVARLTVGDTRKQAGFGLGSMLAAVAIVLLIYQGFASTLAYFRATPVVNEAAAHMEKVSLAAAQYVQDRYANLASSLPLNGAATTITLATIKDSGYLSPSLADRNPYGQSYSLRVRYATQGSGANMRNVLEPLLVTEGGRPIADNVLLRIAGKLSAGGSIRSNTPAVAIGNSGGWEAQLANFGGSPGAGHLAVGMFFSDAGMIADYLYRNSVPGRPEVNQMRTDIDMAANAINNASRIQTGEAHLTRIVAEATACAPAGALARDSAGNPLSCQDGVWTQTASLNWIPAEGQRMRMTAANGQSIWVQNANGRFRWVNSSWTAELASVDQAGNMAAARRLTAGEYLQIGGIATEGTACSPNGLIGSTWDGLILSCQSGVWRPSSGTTNHWYNVTGSRALNAAPYLNTTGHAIFVTASAFNPAPYSNLTLVVDGVPLARNAITNAMGAGITGSVGGMVSAGSEYGFSAPSGSTLEIWAEYR